MELYDIITRLAFMADITFDEALVIMTLCMWGLWGGLIFTTSFFFDLGYYLYRIVKELFLLLFSKFRRKDSVEP